MLGSGLLLNLNRKALYNAQKEHLILNPDWTKIHVKEQVGTVIVDCFILLSFHIPASANCNAKKASWPGDNLSYCLYKDFSTGDLYHNDSLNFYSTNNIRLLCNVDGWERQMNGPFTILKAYLGCSHKTAVIIELRIQKKNLPWFVFPNI